MTSTAIFPPCAIKYHKICEYLHCKWKLFGCFDHLHGKFVDCIIKLLLCMKYFSDCRFSKVKHIYSRTWHPQTSESNVNFSMFEQTPRLLPTFKAWLLSTCSLCFNGEEISTCFEVTILNNRIKTILSLRCCKFKQKGRYNKWIFAFFRLDECERWRQILSLCFETVIICPCLSLAIQLYWNFKLFCFYFFSKIFASKLVVQLI